MPDYAFTNVPVHVIRDESQEAWRWGFELHGDFFEIGRRKLGGWDQQLAAAREAEAKQQQQQPEPEQQQT